MRTSSADDVDPNLSPVAELDRVSKRYARGEEVVTALDRVSLAVAPGEWVALVGPSGCGKSTALGLLAGVDRTDEGAVRVAGLDLAKATEAEIVDLRRRRVGIVFQAFHLIAHLTVAENVALPLSLAARHDDGRVDHLLERVGLSHRRRHFPSELSGGEMQRTAVARALVHRPGLVLADEPTGNLDSSAGERVLSLLDELRREEGAAVLLATHSRAAARMADREFALRDGRAALREPDPKRGVSS